MERASSKTRSNPTLIDKIHAHRRYWVIINSICFKIKKWIKGVGVLAFAFFFVKGLLWIGVIYFGYNWIADFGWF